MCETKVMDSAIYVKVKDIAIAIANASAIDDKKYRWELYQELQEVCLENEDGEKNHPFQWEALADFTDDPKKAIDLYEVAYRVAESKGLKEYSASINLALAERYFEMGNVEKAGEKAYLANDIAKTLSDLELRKEISEFLLNEL
jgi:hypothetical protein